MSQTELDKSVNNKFSFTTSVLSCCVVHRNDNIHQNEVGIYFFIIFDIFLPFLMLSANGKTRTTTLPPSLFSHGLCNVWKQRSAARARVPQTL